MSQEQGIPEDETADQTVIANGAETPVSSVGAVLHPPFPQEQSPQQAATALPQSVAPQPVAATTQPQPLAAPVAPAPTMEQLEERIIDRLLSQLQVLGITQTPTSVSADQPQQ